MNSKKKEKEMYTVPHYLMWKRNEEVMNLNGRTLQYPCTSIFAKSASFFFLSVNAAKSASYSGGLIFFFFVKRAPTRVSVTLKVVSNWVRIVY